MYKGKQDNIVFPFIEAVYRVDIESITTKRCVLVKLGSNSLTKIQIARPGLAVIDEIHVVATYAWNEGSISLVVKHKWVILEATVERSRLNT